jgi:protoporphyrinogen oxidase
MSTAIVVGGGISGLCACKLLAGSGDQVVLVEKNPAIGGLLKSETNELGHVFDQGTHFVVPTSIPELDSLMLEDLDDDDCYLWSDSLKEGSYFNGQLSVDSGCINTRTLPAEIHLQGLAEILNAVPNPDAANLEEFLLNNYGPIFTEHVYAPVVEKFAGVGLKDLHPGAAATFVATRLVVLDRFGASQVKKSKAYDAKIAWAHRDDGTSDIVKRYPKSGGVGAWVDGLETRVISEGAEIHAGQGVVSVSIEGGAVRSVTLDGGKTIECDNVVWTIPPVVFLKAAGIDFTSPPPKFRNLVLLHYSIDAEVNTELHWVVCYDPEFLSFRITLYPNVTQEKRVPAPHHLTVEVMIDDYDIDDLSSRVFGELKQMGLVPGDANILYQSHEDIIPGWPILTTEFEQTVRDAFDLAEKSASNVTFVGRGKSENSHFQNVVLEDLYHALN